MPKRVLLIMILCLSLLGVGTGAVLYRSSRKIIRFSAQDIVSVDIYQVPVPMRAHRKTVTEQKDIRTLISTLRHVLVIGDGAKAEQLNGGGYQFVFHQKGGTEYALSFYGNTLYAPGRFWYEIKGGGKINDLYGKMRYEAVPVPEYALPDYPREKVPALGLRYLSRGEYCHSQAALVGYTWTLPSADGEGQTLMAGGPHALDVSEQVPRYDATQMLMEEGIALRFFMPPLAYSVQRWPMQYAGNAAEYAAFYERVDTPGGRIAIPAGAYVYEVCVDYTQGMANYVFHFYGSE